jgi:hypothetical protein
MYVTCDWLSEQIAVIVVNMICRINFVMYALWVFCEARPKRFPPYVIVELRSFGRHCLLD